MRIASCLVLVLAVAAARSALPAAASGQSATASLVIELTGMTSDDGRVVYALWSGPEHWLEDHALREGAVPVTNGSATIAVRELPYGEYAVSAFHDRNGNGRLDTGLFGIPKEPLGTSNDVKIRFGPPKYDAAAFVIDRPEQTIHILIHKIF